MEEALGFRIVCPFCTTPCDAQVMAKIEEAGAGCVTCGPGAAEGTLEITCMSCQKIIYRKEYMSYD